MQYDIPDLHERLSAGLMYLNLQIDSTIHGLQLSAEPLEAYPIDPWARD